MLTYSGEIRCPSCDLPIDADDYICKYCHSTAPATAPWQPKMTAGMWLVMIVVVIVVLVGWSYVGESVVGLAGGNE